MRFDILLTAAHRPGTEQHEVLQEAVQCARWAEELGYQGAWLLEHHFTRYSLCPSAITMAGFLLGHTRRLRVGSAITIMPLEHPVKLAERAALLDHLSGGRFDFGVGRGAYTRDFDAFGADMAQNHAALLDSLKDILTAWGEEPFPFGTEHRFSADSAVFPVNPKPFTRPHPPVYVASGSPDTVRWAAEHRMPLLMREAMSDAAKRELMAGYAAAAAEQGHEGPGLDHALTTIAVLGDTDAEAVAMARTHVGWWVAEGAAENGLLAGRHLLPNYRTYFEAIDAGKRANGATGDHREFLDKTVELNLIGSPARCRERLAELIENTGIRHLVLGFDANSPGGRTREVMERFMTEVLRPVADQYGASEHRSSEHGSAPSEPRDREPAGVAGT